MTNVKVKKVNLINILYVIMLLIGIILLVILPKISIEAFYMGIRIWATKVLPALLPFFILTKLLSYTSAIQKFGKVFSPVTFKFYGVGGIAGYIYLMSIISGYPVGAKLTSDLYKENIISSKQAQTITSFTSTSGPLFIIGTVAIGMYNSSIIGIIVLLSHMLGAILNGLLYRNKENASTLDYTKAPTPNILNESMISSILSIMVVGGFISLFYMFLQIILQLNTLAPLLKFLQILGVPTSISTSIFAGIIEVTSGCLYLGQTGLSARMLTIISTFLISFGGLSIHAQAFTFLKDFQMSYKKFLLIKTTQSIISTIIAIIISMIFL